MMACTSQAHRRASRPCTLPTATGRCAPHRASVPPVAVPRLLHSRLLQTAVAHAAGAAGAPASQHLAAHPHTAAVPHPSSSTHHSASATAAAAAAATVTLNVDALLSPDDYASISVPWPALSKKTRRAASSSAAVVERKPPFRTQTPRRVPGTSVVTAAGASAEASPIKPEMQDRHVIVRELTQAAAHHVPARGSSSASSGSSSSVGCSAQPPLLVCVCDGHGGDTAAERTVQRLPAYVAASTHLWTALTNLSYAHTPLQQGVVEEGVHRALTHVFADCDRALLAEDRTTAATRKVDGTTVLLGLQVGHHLFTAHAGDSRAVLCRAGHAVRLTKDHTVNDDMERARIEATGGIVYQRYGAWRVAVPSGENKVKTCAVSRAFGDLDFKRDPRHPLISCQPDVAHWPLTPHADRFVIYASDGVWCCIADQDAVDMVQDILQQASSAGLSLEQGAQQAADMLVQLARAVGSSDDITVVVTPFRWGLPAL